SDDVSPGGLYWLRPKSLSQDVENVALDFRIERENRNTLRVQLPSPVSCGLTRIDLRIDYPAARFFLRPNSIGFEFSLSGEPVGKWPMRPIAIGSFTTIVSTVRAGDFYKLFRPGPVPALSWDSIRFDVPLKDRLSVNPSHVDVRKVVCIDPRRFIPATGAAPAEISNAIPDRQPITIGYARILAHSGATPFASGRFSFAASTTEPFAASLTTNTVIGLKGSDSAAIGIALVNPDSRPNVIELSTEDATGKVLRRA